MKKILCILTAVALLSGCASVGRKLDQSKVDQIKKGETTRDQVIQLIGSPDQITRTGDGVVVFQYMYVRASANGASYIPIVGAFAGGVNTQSQMVMVTFNTSNIVSDIFSSYGGNQMNQGLSTGSKAAMNDVETNKRPQ